MKRWFGPLAALAVAAIATHIAVLHEAPRIIMGKAMQRMADRGVPLGRFVLVPRMNPQTQTVVRPSPDLAYSICRFDFSRQQGPIEVAMAAYAGYSSLSFFDAETNNFLTMRGNGKRQTVLLAAPGQATARSIASPTQKGLILIRRLAPDQQSYDRVERIAGSDSCHSGDD